VVDRQRQVEHDRAEHGERGRLPGDEEQRRRQDRQVDRELEPADADAVIVLGAASAKGRQEQVKVYELVEGAADRAP
jgi:hypothetical protein